MKHNYALARANFLAILLAITMLFSVVGLKAQTVTGTATNGTCAANGKITVTATGTTGNVAYQLLAADQSILRSYQTSNVFDNLPAGTYIVQIQDDATNATTVSSPINVATSYEAMLPTVSPTGVSCASALGELTVNVKNGRAPYTYAITAGPLTRPAQDSPTFSNLPIGNYTFSVKDACDVTITVASSISNTGTPLSEIRPYSGNAYVGYFSGDNRNNCSEGAFAHVENWVYLNDAAISDADRANLKWGYEYPANSGKIYGAGGVLGAEPVPLAQFNIPMPAGAVYPYGTGNIILYDLCGNKRTLAPLVAFTAANGRETITGSYNCMDKGVITVTVDHVSLTCLPVTYTFTNQATNAVFTRTATTSGFVSFTGFDPGTYTIVALDANGNNAASNTTVIVPPATPKAEIYQLLSDANSYNSTLVSLRMPQYMEAGTTMTVEVTASTNPLVPIGFTKTYNIQGSIVGLIGPNANSAWPKSADPYTVKLTINYSRDGKTCTSVEDFSFLANLGYTGVLKEASITGTCGGIGLTAIAGQLENPADYFVAIQSGSSSGVGQIAKYADLLGGQAAYPFGNLPFGTYNLALFVNGGSVPLSTQTLTYNASDLLAIDPFQTGGFVCTGSTTGNLVVKATSESGSVLMYAIDGGPYQNSNVFSDVTAGNHTVQVKDDCGNIQTYIALMANATDVKVTTNAAGGALCDGETLQLRVNAPGATSYTWTGPNGFTSSLQNPIIQGVTADNAGTYTVTVVGNCTLVATIDIVVKPNATITLTSASANDSRFIQTAINITISYAITNATEVTVSGLPNGVTGTYANGIFSINGAPTQIGTFNYTVSAKGSCNVVTANGTITVKGDYELLPNNVVTPNGDGKNDTWIVKNIDQYPNSKVTIYDRAGRKLFEAKNYQNNWDGTYKGMPLAEAAYIYVIDVGNDNATIKGTLNIIRENR